MIRNIATGLLGILLGAVLVVACPAKTEDVNAPVLVVPAFHIYFHVNKWEVTKACGVVDKANKLRRVLGCTVRNKTPMEIHIVAPRDWCDAQALHTLGHEMMHLLGGRHPDNYTTPDLSTAPGCTNGRWQTGAWHDG